MRILRYSAVAATIAIVAFAIVWGFLALWYRLPLEYPMKLVACAAFAILGIATVLAQLLGRRMLWLAIFSATFGALIVWWNMIDPPRNGNWSPDVGRQVTGTIEGDVLTLTNVRDFHWRKKDDFTENWVTQTYDLSQLQSADIFLSYWAGPQMAHFILSFGFSDGEYLAWSVEVRREIGSGFSPVADLFKSNALIIVAAKERDVVGVRSNIRGEDVHIFRLRTPPERARSLLVEYVREANELAQTPRWYNSLTTNCTTVIFKMLSIAGQGIRFDWRIIVNGYLPDMMYERGAINTSVSLEKIRELGRIAPRAMAAGLGPDFSHAIRQGVPVPD